MNFQLVLKACEGGSGEKKHEGRYLEGEISSKPEYSSN